MDLFFVENNTKAKTGYAWTPLTKDAGQKVEGIGGLYNVMLYTSDELDVIRKKNWSFKKIITGFSRKKKNLN